VLGPSLCDEAIQTARDQVGEWAARAPELVSRAVVASVTREACSVAGRGVIARVAAEALAKGAGDDDAGDAALAAIEPLAQSLGADAVTVLAQLVDLDG
jgi:1,2-phenylacetyl-CoA epoxidase catalytic subunit